MAAASTGTSTDAGLIVNATLRPGVAVELEQARRDPRFDAELGRQRDKRAVRARMAKTNEKFMAADRNVRKKAGPFEQYVHRIIRFAETWRQEQRSQPQSGNIRSLESLEILSKLDPAEQALEAAVKTGSPEYIAKLETLMYAGRDHEKIHAVHKRLLRDGIELTVDNICGKSPLADYLRSGLDEANAQGVDLEQPF